MKQITIGLFDTRNDAEEAITRLQQDLDIAPSDISYVYRNTEGEVKEVEKVDLADSNAGEGAVSGAVVGGTIGGLAGLATVVGLIPVIGPIFAAGPLIAALGIGGAAGTVAAGAATGAAAGGLIGALVNAGVSEDRAKAFEERVQAGDVLVSVDTDETIDVPSVLLRAGATQVETYKPTL
jgi:uncharacterized membrane protein